MAKLVFYVSALSPDVATAIVDGAIREFQCSHPGLLQEPPEFDYGVDYNTLSVGISLQCDGLKESTELEAEFSQLLDKHEQANGRL